MNRTSKTNNFTLEKGMKIRLLVSPGATPWWYGVGGIMSRSWRMPVWIQDAEGTDIRLAMNVRKLTRAQNEYPAMGHEDPVNEAFVPSTPVHRFMLGAMAAHAAQRNPVVQRVLRCAAQKIENIKSNIFNNFVNTPMDIINSNLPQNFFTSLKKKIDNVESIFNGVKRSLKFDSMVHLPQKSDLSVAAKDWLMSRVDCEIGLVCQPMLHFSGFAKVSLDNGLQTSTVYTDIESILSKVGASLTGEHGCDVERPEVLAKAMVRLAGPAEFVNLPFLWWGAYQKKVVGPLTHMRFLKSVAVTSQEYREMIEQLSAVVLFAFLELVGVVREARTLRGPVPVFPYAGVAARLAEAFLAYRFWSGEDWKEREENLGKGAELLGERMSKEVKFILRERDAAHGGDALTRAVVFLARKPFPDWYRQPANKEDGFPQEVGKQFNKAKKVLGGTILSQGTKR